MCRMVCMATNLALDDRLLDEALRIGGKATKKDTVTEALQEYIARRTEIDYATYVRFRGKLAMR